MIPYPESGPSETQTRGVAPHHQFSQRPRRRIPYPSCHLLKPSSETPPLQRTKSKGPLVTTADQRNCHQWDSFPQIMMNFSEMSLLSSLTQEEGTSRNLPPLHIHSTQKFCPLELCPSQETMVGKQPLPVSSQTSNVFYRALSPKLQAINDWNRALFDFSYTNLCVNGALLPCLLACFVANTQGECCCLPYLPGALVAMRTSLRATQGIHS
ncbi:uncharacterized protein [Notamacropus eugenii]|uniref:uncharacterized protein isoform X2 n=1 Tax=Notamacropus eugenii TaxID=9315 RepID=UPI003B6855E0